jgi:hypothetical protein
MLRKLTVERLYKLGEYQNIKFVNELSDIPEDMYTPEQLQALYADMYLDCDIAYVNYKNNLDRMAKEKVTNSLEYFQQVKEANLELIKPQEKDRKEGE